MFSILGWAHGLQLVVQTVLRMNFSPVTVVANIVGDLGLRAIQGAVHHSAFGISINKDVVRRILAVHYGPIGF